MAVRLGVNMFINFSYHALGIRGNDYVPTAQRPSLRLHAGRE